MRAVAAPGESTSNPSRNSSDRVNASGAPLRAFDHKETRPLLEPGGRAGSIAGPKSPLDGPGGAEAPGGRCQRAGPRLTLSCRHPEASASRRSPARSRSGWPGHAQKGVGARRRVFERLRTGPFDALRAGPFERLRAGCSGGFGLRVCRLFFRVGVIPCNLRESQGPARRRRTDFRGNGSAARGGQAFDGLRPGPDGGRRAEIGGQRSEGRR